jgi:hypothetical protein
MENYIFLVAISIKEILLKISVKAMEKCFGLMVHFIKVNGKEEFKMERARFI